MLHAEIADLKSRIACVVEATYWDRPYDTRIAAIRGMCDLTTDGMTPAVDRAGPEPAALRDAVQTLLAQLAVDRSVAYWSEPPHSLSLDGAEAWLRSLLDWLPADRCDTCGRPWDWQGETVPGAPCMGCQRYPAARAAQTTSTVDGEYEAGESSGYADWVAALGEVVPDDVELLPSVVAEYLARTQAKVARVEAIYAAWMAWDGSRGPDGQMHPDSSSPRDRERLRAALSGEDPL